MEGIEISLHALQETNRKLDLLLNTLRPASETFSLSAEQMTLLMAELLRVGEWLGSGLAQTTEGPLADELERYRVRLEKLRLLLPNVHAQLLTERSRLQAEKAHLEVTARWARSAHAPSR